MSKWCGMIVFKHFGLYHERTALRYQDYRIYLDEYSEQEKLRKIWFNKRENQIEARRQLTNAIANFIKAIRDSGISMNDILQTEKNPYQHFMNRFMRKL